MRIENRQSTLRLPRLRSVQAGSGRRSRKKKNKGKEIVKGTKGEKGAKVGEGCVFENVPRGTFKGAIDSIGSPAGRSAGRLKSDEKGDRLAKVDKRNLAFQA
jgi:hypothetical protein